MLCARKSEAPMASLANGSERLQFDVSGGAMTFCLSCRRSTDWLLKNVLAGGVLEVRLGFSTMALVLSLRLPGIGWASALYHAAVPQPPLFPKRGSKALVARSSVRVYVAGIEQKPMLAFEGILPTEFAAALDAAVARQMRQPCSLLDAWDGIVEAYERVPAEILAEHAAHRFSGRTLCRIDSLRQLRSLREEPLREIPPVHAVV